MRVQRVIIRLQLALLFFFSSSSLWRWIFVCECREMIPFGGLFFFSFFLGRLYTCRFSTRREARGLLPSQARPDVLWQPVSTRKRSFSYFRQKKKMRGREWKQNRNLINRPRRLSGTVQQVQFVILGASPNQKSLCMRFGIWYCSPM